MSNFDVIRAWKDEEYRLSLSDDEQALLPVNPAGSIELSDELLDQVAGGDLVESTNPSLTAGCCPLSALQSCYWTPCLVSFAITVCIQCVLA